MAESSPSTRSPFQSTQPPPAPPLPPSRTGVLQRIIAPLSFNIGARSHGSQTTASSGSSPKNVSNGRVYRPTPAQTAAFKADVQISAIDINQHRTHAVLGGREILKTVRVEDGKVVEDVNLRAAANLYASAHTSRHDEVNKRREYLPAKDVRWSHGQYSHVVATAAMNGRVALYDVTAAGSSRVELSWLYEHAGQVNKLDFDPFKGYMLLSGSQDKTCKIWDIRDPRSPSRWNQYNVRAPVRDVCWSPTDAYEFALCTESGIVQKWDIRSPSQAQLSINAHEKACYTIGWHPDGRHLASGGLDKHLRIWDFKSENRRQKPVFQLRTPQGVLNLAWRPPCWSAEFAQNGQWQSTQVATAYTDDDPRVHVWDLRRPLLPFRELDRYDSRPSDMLWASKDSLWTVGSLGIFTQTNMTHVAQPQDEIAPCAIAFSAKGSLLSFGEDKAASRQLAFADPTAGFLSVPQERLSGVEDAVQSRSLTDDEGMESSMRHRRSTRSKTASSRSAKSQPSTSPPGEGFPPALSLDQAVHYQEESFQNEQVGAESIFEGIDVDLVTLKFVSENYARAQTNRQLQEEPDKILTRLAQAFIRNATVCDAASMFRTAQSWRIMAQVIIPELKSWADHNRRARQAWDMKRRANETLRRHQSDVETRKRESAASVMWSPYTKLPSKIIEARSPARSDRKMGVLFRGIHDPESTSNMTTPLARPLPDSPSAGKRDETAWTGYHENIEPMAPLPPSLLNSHTTATAASNALKASHDESADSPETCADHSRIHRGAGGAPVGNVETHVASPSHMPANTAAAQPAHSKRLDPAFKTRSPLPQRDQEDRRAALREYRAQNRPLFTLEAPVQGPRYGSGQRHGSEESFPMFSASTDSSFRGRSLVESFDSPRSQLRDRQDSEEWQKIDFADDPDSSLSGDASKWKAGGRTAAVERRHFSASEPGPFDMDDAPKNHPLDRVRLEASEKPPAKRTPSSHIWTKEDLQASSQADSPAVAVVSASESSETSQPVHAIHQPRFLHSNPFSHAEDKTRPDDKLRAEPFMKFYQPGDDFSSEHYLSGDFRPVDESENEAVLPFALSCLPVVCEYIAFDVAEGVAGGHFSVHLLMHIHQLFFNTSSPASMVSDLPSSEGLAGRLLRPSTRYRAIETILAGHHEYLKRTGFFVPLAELRKCCVELGYTSVYKTEQGDEPVGNALTTDSSLIPVSCSACRTGLPGQQAVCHVCHRPRDACPVCEQRVEPSALRSTTATALTAEEARTGSHGSVEGGTWTFCHACGHSGHLSCMTEWFGQADGEGACPTRDCGCGCGTGSFREDRIRRQVQALDDEEAIRGSHSQQKASSVSKRDPHKAWPSPAVDKARDTLRSSRSYTSLTTGTDHETQSGDEGTSGFGGGGRRRTSASRGASGNGVGSRGGGTNGGDHGGGHRGLGLNLGPGPTPSHHPNQSQASSTSGPRAGLQTNSSFGRRVRLITPAE